MLALCLGTSAAPATQLFAQEAAAPAQTIQQQFDAGTAAIDKEDWAAADRIFGALEERVKGGSARSRAIVRLRRAKALMQLGQLEQSTTAIRAALPDLPESDQSLHSDLSWAYSTLGYISQRDLAYADAVEQFKHARLLATTPAEKVVALYGYVETQTFVDPKALGGSTAELMKLVEADSHVSKNFLAQILMAKGRAELNTGDVKSARTDFEAAVRKLGGLSTRVDADDVRARSDAHVANALLGDEMGALKYVLYTGAGRFDGANELGATDLDLPPCGGSDGLRPDDVAIVELSITDEGAVGSARPIYGSRSGPMALIFARYVRDWSWSPEKLKDINPFFRRLSRVELRCTNAVAPRPSVSDFLRPAVVRWSAQQGFPMSDLSGSAVEQARVLREGLARVEKEKGSDSLAAFPYLVGLIDNAVVNRFEGGPYVRRAMAIAEAAGAPTPVRAHLFIHLDYPGRKDQFDFEARRRAYADAIASGRFGGDPASQAVVILSYADGVWGSRDRAELLPLLRSVASQPRFGDADPLRVGALMRIAAIEQAEGNIDAAQKAYARTGLSADQCALVDAKPELKSAGNASFYYPTTLVRAGLTGYSRIEYDIEADGRVSHARTILSYPPFAFDKASEEIIGQSTFEKTFRPDGGAGCTANASNMRYAMPK